MSGLRTSWNLSMTIQPVQTLLFTMCWTLPVSQKILEQPTFLFWLRMVMLSVWPAPLILNLDLVRNIKNVLQTPIERWPFNDSNYFFVTNPTSYDDCDKFYSLLSFKSLLLSTSSLTIPSFQKAQTIFEILHFLHLRADI